jgi:anti-sigma factor RsiW
MHQPIRERLEEYLDGMIDAGGVREIEDHLASCKQCRNAVDEMRRQSELLKILCPPAEMEPAPGFYARVIDRIESQKTPSVWNALMEPALAKRIAYASLTLLVLMGTLAVSVDREEDMVASSPEIIMSEEPVMPPFGVDQQRDRDVVLVNLATYEY